MSVSSAGGSFKPAQRLEVKEHTHPKHTEAVGELGIFASVLHAIYENTIGLVAAMLGFHNPIEHKPISERSIEKHEDKPIEHPKGFEITDDAFNAGIIEFQRGYEGVERTGDVDRMVSYIIQETKSEDPVQRMVALTFLTRLVQFAANNVINADAKVSLDCTRILNNEHIMPAIRLRSRDDNPTIKEHAKQYLTTLEQLNRQNIQNLAFAFQEALQSGDLEIVIGFFKHTSDNSDPVQRAAGFEKMLQILEMAKGDYSWLKLFEHTEMSRLIGQGRGDSNPKIKVLAETVYQELNALQAQERFDIEFNNVAAIQDPALMTSFLVSASKDGDPERRLLAMGKIEQLLLMAQQYAHANPEDPALFNTTELRASIELRKNDAHPEVRKLAADILSQLIKAEATYKDQQAQRLKVQQQFDVEFDSVHQAQDMYAMIDFLINASEHIDPIRRLLAIDKIGQLLAEMQQYANANTGAADILNNPTLRAALEAGANDIDPNVSKHANDILSTLE